MELYRLFWQIHERRDTSEKEILNISTVFRGVLEQYRRLHDSNLFLRDLAHRLVGQEHVTLLETFQDFTSFIGRVEFKTTGAWIRKGPTRFVYSHSLYFPGRKYTLKYHLERGLQAAFDDLHRRPLEA